MTTQNRSTSETQKSNTSQGAKLADTKTLVTRTSNRDWDSFIGLMIMVGLTGLAAVSMVVDTSVLRKALNIFPSSPLIDQPQIAEQSTIKMSFQPR